MKLIKSLIPFILLVLLLACNNNKSNEPGTTPSQNKSENAEQTSSSNKGQAFIEDEGGKPNALQLAVKSDDHTTLVKAVKAAGVENSLVNAGPLTVFAPTNGAFDKVDQPKLNNLLKPKNKRKLANLLINHVAPSNYPTETLKKNIEKGRKLYMASGNYVEITEKDGDLYVGNAKIITTVDVSNGWVHIVDQVIQ